MVCGDTAAIADPEVDTSTVSTLLPTRTFRVGGDQDRACHEKSKRMLCVFLVCLERAGAPLWCTELCRKTRNPRTQVCGGEV